jgi:polyphosphate kinase
MITETLLEKARLHVRRWFARRMPKHMVFHDLEHTLTVARTAVALGQSMQLPFSQIALLELAALFHDTGYANVYKGHEQESARLADAFLKKHKVSRRDIGLVHRLILATVLDAVPADTLEKIMRDADSAKAGQADFSEKSELLRLELGTVRGARPKGRAWLQENIDYLKGHRFHTPQGRRRYQQQKRINLGHMEEQVKHPALEDPLQGAANDRYFDRDLSWLAFNERVLQEARDPEVPLLERIKFLAIFSSNLDEFYRVRVASLRSLAKLGRSDRTALGITPAKLVEQINRRTLLQQQEFGELYRNTLLPALEQHGIRILQEDRLTAAQKRFVRTLFKDRVQPLLNTAVVRPGNAPFIEDRKLYFACRIKAKGKSGGTRTVLLNIPSSELGRFVVLPSSTGSTDILFLDDVVRMGLKHLFAGHKVLHCHAIKLSRDAELHLDEEFTGNVKEKVKKSLKKRQTGVPSRFLFDHAMPKETLRELRALLGLKKADLVPGGRYHNFNDLMQLPVEGHPELRFTPWPPLPHPLLAVEGSLFAVVARQDVLLHYPYHDFGQFIRWLREAATDAAVRHISVSLYRVADGSAVCAALLDALHNGKKVTVFVEVQARFDENSNLFWGEALEQAGAEVLYSYAHLKVHCKLCLVERRELRRTVRYAYLGTGNFNERTARIYSDMGLFTNDPRTCREVAEVFAHLKARSHRPAIENLLMAPISLRSRLEELIDREIAHAMRGHEAHILLKLNSLEDQAMIRKLYDASRAGVRIRLIVRGICCLVPGVPGSSENISVISIIDRYLEHARVYVFHNGGKPMVYLSSADLMERNLDRRVEVAFPITDTGMRREVLHLLELQWNDRVKARLIEEHQVNAYVPAHPGPPATASQEATWLYYKNMAKADGAKKKRATVRKDRQRT